MAIPETDVTEIGGTVFLADIDGGTAGLPLGLVADFLKLSGRAGGQVVHGGTAPSEEIIFQGSSDANLGLARFRSPIVFDDVQAAVALSPYFLAASPTQTFAGAFIGGGANMSPTLSFGSGVAIWEGFRVAPVISSTVNLTFAAFTILQCLPLCTSSVSGRNPMNVSVINAGPAHEYTGSSGSVLAVTTGMNWLPQLKATTSGGTISWAAATCLLVAPKFSTVIGTTANLGPIRGIWGQNPGVALFGTSGGVETMTSYVLVDMNDIPFGGNVTKAAVRSAQAAATNAYFLLQLSNAQSRFVGQVQHRSNTLGSKWGSSDEFGIRFNGTQAEFEWLGGDSLLWENVPAFNYWKITNPVDQGLQWDVAKIAFGDVAPLLTRNWSVAFFPKTGRGTNFAGEWTDVVFQPTGPVVLAHNITTLAAWLIRESQITRGAFDLDVACTLWVDTVPTEGDENYAIYSPNGTSLVTTLEGMIEGTKLSRQTVAIVDVGTAGATSALADSTRTTTLRWVGVLSTDISTSGAGGLDTGSEATDTWYAVHVLGDTTGANAPVAMLSLSATAPTLPGTHNVFRRVGWVRNKANGDIRGFSQQGSGRTKRYYYDTGNDEVRVLNAGNATTYTDVDCSIGAPPTSRWIQAALSFRTSLSGSGEHHARLRENGFTGDGAHRFRPGVVSGNTLRVSSEVGLDASQLLEYQVSDATNRLDIRIMGFEDDL